MAMLSLERLDWNQCDWDRMDAYHDRVIFQTREWVSFVARTQNAEPVVAAVKDGGATVGYLTALIVRRFGIGILGSPFPGWTTSYMGFNLDNAVPRREALKALPTFAYKSLGCLHLELKDRRLNSGDAAGLGFAQTLNRTFELDLSSSEEEMFRRMSSASRRCIRKAEKIGVLVEEAADVTFADDYYAQLVDVFAKQSLTPTYAVERVRELVRELYPTGRLLLLRARAPSGECIATGIFPAMNGTAYFWGGASWREHQHYRPNEAIFWYAMRYWKHRGMRLLDMGGGGDYKRKYGPTEFTVPSFRKSRIPGLAPLRDVAESLSRWKFRRSRRGRVRPLAPSA
jgi:CelD/BcsL family acetyltransferase involved in cellulose biosynthesis